MLLLNRDTEAEAPALNVARVHGSGDGAAISVSGLERRFGDFYAVKGLTFSVRRGEIFGLLGPNGAGKSTTFRMLCGLLPATGGTLEVGGLNLRRAAAKARKNLGYMAQKFSLYGQLSVLENLNFFSKVYGLSGPRREARVQWALQELDLADEAEATAGELPFGFRQRLSLACALMHEPDILFLDEPTSGVDPLARRQFWARINSLAERGVTVVVTTHFMEEAEYCDRMLIMMAGELLAQGTPDEIRRHAGTDGDATIEKAFITLVEEHRARQKED
jgi:ABC-type multidrug transport system ATPase subunit